MEVGSLQRWTLPLRLEMHRRFGNVHRGKSFNRMASTFAWWIFKGSRKIAFARENCPLIRWFVRRMDDWSSAQLTAMTFWLFSRELISPASLIGWFFSEYVFLVGCLVGWHWRVYIILSGIIDTGQLSSLPDSEGSIQFYLLASFNLRHRFLTSEIILNKIPFLQIFIISIK